MKKVYSFIVALTAAGLIFWLCGLYKESSDALKWPKTKGEVISSELVIHHLPKFFNVIFPDPFRWYSVDVEYEYTAGDGRYSSNRIAIQDSVPRSVKSALGVMNKYRHLHVVNVSYNPLSPTQSVLEPGNIGDIFFPVMTALTLFLVWLIGFAGLATEYRVSGVQDYLHWGNLYQSQGRYEAAFIEFSKIIDTSPQIAQGYKSRGNLLWELEKWDDAITDFTQAIAIDPTDAAIFFKRGMAHFAQKQSDKALKDMEKAMEKGHKVKTALLNKIKSTL